MASLALAGRPWRPLVGALPASGLFTAQASANELRHPEVLAFPTVLFLRVRVRVRVTRVRVT